MASVATYKANALEPIRDRILVRDMVFGERLTAGGIIMVADDRQSQGIRPRWAEVYAVGPDQKEINAGDWIMVAHGRWTRGMKMEINGEEMEIRMVDNNDIMLVSDTKQIDETFSEAMIPQSDRHRIEGSMHNHAGGGILD
jgi:co-chaperonin GroES (HSP10)